jgi:hypothetical protein
MRVRILALAAAFGAALAACERNVEQDGLASTQGELTDEQVERALGPEPGKAPGNADAGAAIDAANAGDEERE